MEANNMKALREALEKINRLCGIGVVEVSSFEIGSICDAALSAPPRNCDVGTAKEQYERWQAFCDTYDEDCKGCPCDGPCLTMAYCFSNWAQMPYEKQDNK